jgi:TonB family protein
MKKLIFLFMLSAAFVTAINAQTTTVSETKIADEWPMFPGCETIEGNKAEIRQCADQKLFGYLHSNLKYPELARKNKIEGSVVIKFFIDNNGNVSKAEIAQDIGDGCGDAALKVINQMIAENIQWIPAKLDGKNVAMEFALPFKFAL